MDLDLALRVDEPLSNIGKSICGSIFEHAKVKEYLKAIEQQFKTSNKALASTLMTKMCFMKFNGTKGVHEHIMEMRDTAAQLKSLEIEMFESFLVHFILNSLSSEYEPFRISYNTHKEKWFINELLTMCVQEEGRLNQERIESAHLATQEKKPSKKSKEKQKTPLNHVNKSDIKCFFCKKKGHIKKSYPKFKAWLEKKDDPIMFSQALGGSESTLWYNAMKDEMNSMANNQVWDLVELPKGAKNDSFRIIMALVAHFDMELYQMDVKTTFLNGDLEEEVYMKQPEGFITNRNDHIVFRRLMYGQVCTRPDISYAVGMLGRYQNNPSLEYWKAAKKFMRYLKGIRDYKLT
ncbi:Retrovirus-related Pol polyprotein from transposon TNT 1-94 [Vitis vinifera]|uniref:Retrovirus-related Pol polyprotein from transposon TNT 1-94 n=1 Tax=Vitis vinifera TaxID=29760 RepID=A0A438ILW4_VITVI|nr:Retrovirus-related Pol polyprotein from transposon TNT 1-94 [Vitis vinifera]